MVAICHSKIAPNNWDKLRPHLCRKTTINSMDGFSICLGEFQTYLRFLPPKLMVSIIRKSCKNKNSDTPWKQAQQVGTWFSQCVVQMKFPFGVIWAYFQNFCCERSQGMYRILSASSSNLIPPKKKQTPHLPALIRGGSDKKNSDLQLVLSWCFGSGWFGIRIGIAPKNPDPGHFRGSQKSIQNHRASNHQEKP